MKQSTAGDNSRDTRSAISRTHIVAQSFSANVITKVIWTGLSMDNLSESDSNGKFIAKNAGIYSIDAKLMIATTVASGQSVTLTVYVNGVGLTNIGKIPYVGSTFPWVTGHINLRLNAGDYVEIYIQSTAAVISHNDAAFSSLSITRIA